jgi:hypothetical protein
VRRTLALLLSLAATASLAQELSPAYKPEPAVKKVPAGVLLVKGAEPSASDSKTPLPENGRLADDAYSNDYFGLSFKLPPQLAEIYKGPPPSDSGKYVLTELVPSERYKGNDKATMLVTAQDHFFALTPQRNAAETIKMKKETLPSYYEAERPPYEMTIAGRKFARLDYTSPVAGIHWIVMATDIRCHSVEFVLTGRDPKVLETLVAGLGEMTLTSNGSAPACVADYAEENTLYRKDPELTDHKFNPIPVRVVIDTKGRVKHVHILSAFPEQARAITDALFQWRLKPYVVNGAPAEVETGIMFGAPQRTKKETKTVVASD